VIFILLYESSRITSVINKENQDRWISCAKTSTQKEIEREVVRVSPQAAVKERIRYVTHERLEFKVGISEQLHTKLKRAQDLVCQSKGKPATFEDVLEAALENFLEHKDPVRKAERVMKKKSTPVSLGVRQKKQAKACFFDFE
jgi:hypothetical protein